MMFTCQRGSDRNTQQRRRRLPRLFSASVSQFCRGRREASLALSPAHSHSTASDLSFTGTDRGESEGNSESRRSVSDFQWLQQKRRTSGLKLELLFLQIWGLYDEKGQKKVLSSKRDSNLSLCSGTTQIGERVRELLGNFKTFTQLSKCC